MSNLTLKDFTGAYASMPDSVMYLASSGAFQIFSLINKHPRETLFGGDIYNISMKTIEELTGMSWRKVSCHISELENLNFIKADKEGRKKVTFKINWDEIHDSSVFISKIDYFGIVKLKELMFNDGNIIPFSKLDHELLDKLQNDYKNIRLVHHNTNNDNSGIISDEMTIKTGSNNNISANMTIKDNISDEMTIKNNTGSIISDATTVKSNISDEMTIKSNSEKANILAMHLKAISDEITLTDKNILQLECISSLIKNLIVTMTPIVSNNLQLECTTALTENRITQNMVSCNESSHYIIDENGKYSLIVNLSNAESIICKRFGIISAILHLSDPTMTVKMTLTENFDRHHDTNRELLTSKCETDKKKKEKLKENTNGFAVQRKEEKAKGKNNDNDKENKDNIIMKDNNEDFYRDSYKEDDGDTFSNIIINNKGYDDDEEDNNDTSSNIINDDEGYDDYEDNNNIEEDNDEDDDTSSNNVSVEELRLVEYLNKRVHQYNKVLPYSVNELNNIIDDKGYCDNYVKKYISEVFAQMGISSDENDDLGELPILQFNDMLYRAWEELKLKDDKFDVTEEDTKDIFQFEYYETDDGWYCKVDKNNVMNIEAKKYNIPVPEKPSDAYPKVDKLNLSRLDKEDYWEAIIEVGDKNVNDLTTSEYAYYLLHQKIKEMTAHNFYNNRLRYELFHKFVDEVAEKIEINSEDLEFLWRRMGSGHADRVLSETHLRIEEHMGFNIGLEETSKAEKVWKKKMEEEDE